MAKSSARLIALRILWKGQRKSISQEDLDLAVFSLITRIESDPEAFAKWRTRVFAEAIAANRTDVLSKLEWIFGMNDMPERK